MILQFCPLFAVAFCVVKRPNMYMKNGGNKMLYKRMPTERNNKSKEFCSFERNEKYRTSQLTACERRKRIIDINLSFTHKTRVFRCSFLFVSFIYIQEVLLTARIRNKTQSKEEIEQREEREKKMVDMFFIIVSDKVEEMHK